MKREELEKRKKQLELERLKQTALLVVRFMIYNESDKQLEKKTGIKATTVGYRLKDKEKILMVYDNVKIILMKNGWKEEDIPESGEKLFEVIAKKRLENREIAKQRGFNNASENAAGLSGMLVGNQKLNLQLLGDTEEKQYKLLARCALYFRLHLNELSSLFGIEENVLESKLKQYNYEYFIGNHALPYLLYEDIFESRQKDFVIFYYDYVKSDEIGKKGLLDLFKDVRANEIMKKHDAGDRLSDEDIITIIKYQLKYAYTDEKIAKIFDFNSYRKRLNTVLEKYPEYKEQVERLKEFHLNYHYNNQRGR